MPIDVLIFDKINGLAFKSLWLDAVGVFLARYLPYVLVAVLVALLIKDFRKYWRAIAGAFLAGGMGLTIVEVIRLIWLKPRPFVVGEVNLLMEHSSSGSFPSLHTTIFFAISAGLLCYWCKKDYPASERKIWQWLSVSFMAASFLMAISRIFCGVHWPSDILGGMALGGLCGFVVCKVFRRIFRRANTSLT